MYFELDNQDRMLKLKMWRRKYFYYLPLLAILNIVCVIYFNRPESRSSCDHYGTVGVIEDTCMNYRSHLIEGSLCEDLCTLRTLNLIHCVDHKIGRTVLFMNYTTPERKPEIVVLKVQIMPSDVRVLTTRNDTGRPILYSVESLNISNEILESRISLVLSKQLGESFKKLNESVLSEIWGYNFTKYVNSLEDRNVAIQSALRSIWLLVQQREYLILRLHQHVKSIPKLYGTCGAIFLMEYANSIGGLKTGFNEGRGVSIHLSDWKRRAKYAVDILELEPSLNTEFLQTFHLCDVKDPNIGMRGDHKVTLIDLDHGLFESELHERLGDMECIVDWDCGFLTCPGLCDRDTNRCKRFRANNNLQSICEKVFLDKLVWVNTGLLRGPPPAIEHELMDVLHRCAYPPSRISPTAHADNFLNNIRGGTRRELHYPGEDIRLKLIEIIKKGLAL